MEMSMLVATRKQQNGNTCYNFSCLKDVELCPTVVDTLPLKYPVQCVDNRDGRDGQVVFDSESFHSYFHSIRQPNASVQCLENPEGKDGVVVIGRESFPIPLLHLSSGRP